MKILAFETSCDETAVAILSGERDVRANVLHSQVALHRPYGGIVPEIASRSHVEHIHPLLTQALHDAELNLADIDLVAATRGPGLLGALLIGMQAAQGLAAGLNKPFVGVNHLHGHLLSPDLVEPMQFPALVLLVTGGHTATYVLHDELTATLVQRTVDDAVGEAFDKVAKLLGLSYPGGPVVERMARNGDPDSYRLPVPRPKDQRALSLSGLKTAVRRHMEGWSEHDERDVQHLCAAFQATVGKLLTRAIDVALDHYHDCAAVYLVGGVAQNNYIRETLTTHLERRELQLYSPPPALCTDNAAMIARAARALWRRRPEPDPWDQQPCNRWEFGQWPAA